MNEVPSHAHLELSAFTAHNERFERHVRGRCLNLFFVSFRAGQGEVSVIRSLLRRCSTTCVWRHSRPPPEI